MATIKFSDVEIIPNYNMIGNIKYNTEALKEKDAVDFYKGKGIINGKDVVYGINNDGKFVEMISLPCPPYCQGKGDGSFVIEVTTFDDERLKFLSDQDVLNDYRLEDIKELKKKKANTFLEIEVKLNADTPNEEDKTAIIGIDKNGNILQGDDDLVVYN